MHLFVTMSPLCMQCVPCVLCDLIVFFSHILYDARYTCLHYLFVAECVGRISYDCFPTVFQCSYCHS